MEQEKKQVKQTYIRQEIEPSFTLYEVEGHNCKIPMDLFIILLGVLAWTTW